VPHWFLRARKPTGNPASLRVVRDAELVRPYLEDAAHFPGGRAVAVAAPESEAEVAAALALSDAILPIGAQSSLTGGGTPMGELVLTTSRMNHIGRLSPGLVRVGAGVALADLDAALLETSAYYPPAPTFAGAFVGGTVATNAAGAATFKYGATRDWVQAVTVVLASGDVLDIERGETTAHADGYFELNLDAGVRRVDIPGYVMPGVPKLSAGYFAKPGMDLLDLFIGSEGTLGVVTEVTLKVLPERPATCMLFVPFDDRARGLQFVERLRRASRETWQSHDPNGVDVSAIEHMDARCLELLRQDGADRACGVPLSASTRLALLITMELPGADARRVYEDVGRAGEGNAPDSPIGRALNLLAEAYCSNLSDPACLEQVEIAVPGDRRRAGQFLALREAVPAAVNARIAAAQRASDPLIEKTAADMIVPFDKFAAFLDFYETEFARRGLDAAIWGHVSDGNVHPNVIPRTMADVESGREAILAFGREAIRLGGSPLAEHGVGRNRTKQHLLVELYGKSGVEQMQHVKDALDPEWKLAPGVLFPKLRGHS
jgi:D-lactate dehydrogenase (cytochrome)